MISRELETEILRLYHAEGWRIGTLGRQLHVLLSGDQGGRARQSG
jgi:hypothetical protein